MNKERGSYRLYLITDEKCMIGRDFIETVEEALQGGVTMVQFREKNMGSREFYTKALALHQLTKTYHVPLIINDRIDIALAIGAEGVHLGQKDLPISVARKLMGDEMILGASTATIEEAILAEKEGADYIGVGAMYATGTKVDTRPVSLDTLGIINVKVNIPVVAIGGITLENVPEVLKMGTDGVAVISAILKTASPKQAAKDFMLIMEDRGGHKK